jgi:drug/metabolite transporter (DMT)-like permease
MIAVELGVVAACGASLMENVGVVLQAVDAREVPHHHALRLSLLTRLLRRPRWLAGTVLGYLAVPLEVVALSRVPLVVVEPLLASGLLVLLFAGRRLLGERIHAPQIAGICAIVVGLILVAWGGPTGRGAERGAATVILVIGLVCAVAVVPYVIPRHRAGVTLILISSAAGFSAANMAINALSFDLHVHDYLAGGAWLAVAAVSGLAATITQRTAFQRRAAIGVVPVTFAVPNFLPVALAPLFLREQWGTTPLGGAVLAIGVVVALAGSLALGRSPQVAKVAASTVGLDVEIG